ncbi:MULTISPECIES: 3'(2'),5'-bisphosphate nucleotidase CysQ [unclassified Novosphingobium]|uniref:3'(2'),5'-bisphosphate nucleotidase CysQ n=1 Tax=unclassified Novosphingobium TaxID=2644732 RepID=UPI00135A99DF|nr:MULTISPECIES: 3'(2'),5'-bisphosphate nucleotidase CysQ [unclassified Novosphingobium]
MIDRERLEAIVREAGRIALAGWPGDGHSLESWEKTPGSPVCTADLEVDGFLKAELHKLLPAAGWLSEETTDSLERQNHELVWLVDPIDGTRDFIRGRTGWAISVALVNTRRPLLGYLYAPVRQREDGGEFWFAEAGKGAWRNGKRLVASHRDSLAGSRVPALKLAAEDADLTLVDQPNSIALRMAMIAADEADLLVTLRWGYEWDIAAAGLIAREAGAVVTDAFGQPLNYNKHDPRAFGVMVASTGIHEAAVERLAERAVRYSA